MPPWIRGGTTWFTGLAQAGLFGRRYREREPQAALREKRPGVQRLRAQLAGVGLALNSSNRPADHGTMLGKGNSLNLPRAIQVILDGRELRIPDHIRDSLPAIRSYLELLAIQQERVLWDLSVDGTPVHSQADFRTLTDFQRIQAQTVTFTELTRQLIDTAQAQVRALQNRVEAAAMQVLINDWPAVEKLWQQWAPEFLSPILIIKSLRDLCGARMDELTLGHQTLAEHLAKFGPLWTRTEQAFERRDILDLSNAMDQLLGPWLAELSAFLAKLNEA